jgi:protein-S-isoprenylcysteine O-methyltransferase Ste14
MLVMSRKSEVTAEGTPARAEDVGERAARIHLSAIVAFSCYFVGLVATACAAAGDPAKLDELLDGGPGDYVLLLALVGFFVVIAIIQRHMGISLRASQTLTPGQLCTSGVFKYSRNPIYLAFILPLAALSYFSPLSAALAIGLYVLTMTQFVIRGEERTLRSKFGAAYEAYSRRTPRWIFI